MKTMINICKNGAKAVLSVAVCTSMASLLLSSCGTTNQLPQTDTKPSQTITKPTKQAEVKRLNAENAVSSIDFTINAMGKDISVDGKLQMRRDKIIRITLQAPLIGFEVGRIEFTPEYALIIDKINKQYVKAAYSDISFLKNNGLDYYTLQALFWNERDKINSSLFTITNNELQYTKDGAKFSWAYDSYANVEKVLFPNSHSISFVSKSVAKGKNMKVNISLKKVTTNSSWDATSEVSSKYKQVKAEDLLKKLISI